MAFLVAPGFVLICGIEVMRGFVAVYGIVVMCGLVAVFGFGVFGVKQVFIMVSSFASFVLTFLVSLVTSFSSLSS